MKKITASLLFIIFATIPASNIFADTEIPTPTVLAPQTITFPPLLDVSLSDRKREPRILLATSTSGLFPIYTITTENVCFLDMISPGEIYIGYEEQPGQCTIAANQPGNDLFEPATTVTQTFFVDDTDGVGFEAENSGPNGGDANGNGIADSLESSVVAGRSENIPGNPYITLQVDGDISPSSISDFNINFSLDVLPSDYLYPIGIIGFTARGGFEGGVDVSIILDKVYDTSLWTLKKFFSGEPDYTVTVPNVVFSVVTIGGVEKTKISYYIRDYKGEHEEGEVVLDSNPNEGIITDPVFVVAPIPPVPPVIAPPSSGGIVFNPNLGAPNFNAPIVNIGKPVGLVLGASTTAQTSCKIYMDPKGVLFFGKNNNREQVELLQKFLNLKMNNSLEINGNYDRDTQKAVENFQLKYKSEVLTPWGISAPTGITYYSTINKINRIMCVEQAEIFDNKYLIPISKLQRN